MTRKLWAGAVFAGAADIATTWYGIRHANLIEINPIVVSAAENVGLIPAVLLIKIAVLLFCVGIYLSVTDRYTKASVPVAVIAVWLTAVWINLWFITQL